MIKYYRRNEFVINVLQGSLAVYLRSDPLRLNFLKA